VAVLELSAKARAVVEHEHEAVVAQIHELRRQSEALHALAEDVDAALRAAARRLRHLEETLGTAPQLPLEAAHAELRGERLRTIAVEVLRKRRGEQAVVHYTEWLRLLEEEGLRVGGKNPGATLLTQIARSPNVVSVRPRSGLYRLQGA
jgi:hypothetical protein